VNVILDIVLPVFGVMVIGYGAAWLGFFGEQSHRVLTRFVFNFAIPALLFRSLATTDLPPVLPWGHLLSYYLSVLVCMALGMAAGRLIRGRKLDGQTIVGLNAGFGNAVLVGVPLVLTAFGDKATLPLFLIIAFHSVLLTSAGTLLIEISHGSRAGLKGLPLSVAKAMATNPIVVSLILGLAMAASGLPFPKAANDIARLLGSAAAPCALFAMGATLPQYRIAGNLLESIVVTTIKLVVHPAIVWALATYVFAVEPLYCQVAVILAATPVGVNAYILATRYNVGIATSTTAIFLTTAGSMVTLSAVLYLLLGVSGL
jgi:malonate transporter